MAMVMSLRNSALGIYSHIHSLILPFHMCLLSDSTLWLKGEQACVSKITQLDGMNLGLEPMSTGVLQTHEGGLLQPIADSHASSVVTVSRSCWGW